MLAERRQAQAQDAVTSAPLWDGRPEVITGADRLPVAAWLAVMGGWWTSQESLHALDDLVAGLPLDDVLRVVGEEGFTQVGERDYQDDLQVFLLDEDGLLAEVFAPREGTGTPTPWSLTIYGNREILDPML